MLWFKHFSDASDDDFLEELECEFGLEGYARWWKLLEVIARPMGKKHPHPYASHSIGKWCSFLKAKRKILIPFLEHCENKSRINVELNGNIMKITCPKLLEIKDEYYRKSGHDPDTDRTTPTSQYVSPSQGEGISSSYSVESDNPFGEAA